MSSNLIYFQYLSKSTHLQGTYPSSQLWNPPVTNKTIAIERGRNPEYFSLLDEHNAYVVEYRRINPLLTSYLVPRVFLCGQKKKILVHLGTK